MAEDNFAMGYALGQDSNGNRNYVPINTGGGWGGGMDGIMGLAALGLVFGRNGLFGNNNGNDGNCNGNCATQADVRSAVDQQTLISKIDQQTYGLADTFTALNNSLNSNFRGVDNAICTLGFQNQQGVSSLSAQLAGCCCDIERGIDRNTTQGVMNTNAIQQQISNCCCDLEKMNLQNRFDAQTYNCNTLQAIDKLGDRIEGRLSAMETDRLRQQLDDARTHNAILQGRIDRDQLRYDIVNDVTCSWGNGWNRRDGWGNWGNRDGWNWGRNSDGCGCGSCC